MTSVMISLLPPSFACMSVQITRRGWQHQHTVMLLYTDAQTQSVCHADVMSAFFFAAEQRHFTHPLKFSLPFFAPPRNVLLPPHVQERE